MTEIILPDSLMSERQMVAMVNGEQLLELPEQLYVPANSLRVTLESFEGPLDLLLYLIKKDNINILDIPIARIAEQYLSYVQMINELKLDVVADYLVMAAYLAEIKSKLLLPSDQESPIEEEDPRAELVKRLQEYEKYKDAALKLDELPRQERDIFNASLKFYELEVKEKPFSVKLDDLLYAFRNVLIRVSDHAKHFVKREVLSVREKMTIILDSLTTNSYSNFDKLFNLQEGKMGVIVTFIAILELLKQNLIEISQEGSFQPIQVKRILC